MPPRICAPFRGELAPKATEGVQEEPYFRFPVNGSSSVFGFETPNMLLPPVFSG